MNNTREIIKNQRINEEYIHIKHPSGLSINLYPMEGYSEAYALFATKYGSIDTTFKTDEDEDFVTVPEGIAHYLEHKLFENEDCDTFELFGKTGSDANAFTSFDKTAYLFSCTQAFEQNLEILLNFVQDPYFTDETVAKEQGIIGQEIQMYEDDLIWSAMFDGLQSLYHNNPVRVNIAGTIESISHINKELLYRCYKTFYNLNNMTLCIAGNFDVEKTLEICDRLLKPSADKGLQSVIPEEPDTILQKRTSRKMSCSIPIFMTFIKCPNFVGRENTLNYVHYNILLDMLFGETSSFYNDMYKAGDINDSFSAGVFNGRGFFALQATGESKNPDKVYAALLDTIEQAKKNGLSEENFTNIKKKTYGQLVMGYGSVSSVAMNMLEATFNDCNVYDLLEITASTTFEDIKATLNAIDIEKATLSVVEPI